MTYLAQLMTTNVSPPDAEARRLATTILVPNKITRPLIQRYLARALRNGAWHRLAHEARALLLVAAKIIAAVRSPRLREVLTSIFLEIELVTARGKAVLLAVTHLLGCGEKPTAKPLQMLLYMGLSILNNPFLNPELVE